MNPLVKHIEAHPVGLRDRRKYYSQHTKAIQTILADDSLRRKTKESISNIQKIKRFNNLGKIHQNITRNENIEKQNGILLSKIVKISQRDRNRSFSWDEKQSSFSQLNASSYYSNRRQRSLIIAKENLRLVNRLMNSQSTLNKKNFVKHIENHVNIRNRISRLTETYKKDFSFHMPPARLTKSSRNQGYLNEISMRSVTPIKKLAELECFSGMEGASKVPLVKRIKASKLCALNTAERKEKHKEIELEKSRERLKLVLLEQNHIRAKSSSKVISKPSRDSINVSYISGKKITITQTKTENLRKSVE